MLGARRSSHCAAGAVRGNGRLAKASGASIGKALADEVRFVSTFARNRSKIGAISPSSRALGKLMVQHASPDADGFTLELGPGTGVFTQALINYGVPPDRIIAVEHDAAFCRVLAERFPKVSIVHGDAFDLDATLSGFSDIRFSAALSGLPLLSFPKQVRMKCIDGVLDRMMPGKGMTQFSYGLYPAVEPIPGRIAVAKSKWVLMNLPPARVWTYRRP